MQVILAGLGCGTAATMTAEARDAMEHADCLIGARRLLNALPPICTQTRLEATRPREVLALLRKGGFLRPCVVYSGDTGFYSGVKALLPLLEQEGISAQVLPGISSVQLLSARLGRPWQDWVLCSAHGAVCDPVTAVMAGRPAFFLTGGALGPSELCTQLTQAGLGDLPVTVGENLSYEHEQILTGTASAFAERSFAPLSVLLAEPAPQPCKPCAPGMGDGSFLRAEVPMTKQEVRAAVLAKLAIEPEDTVWDVGAGTGSVSVELARAAFRGRVFAVECSEEACRLVEKNRERFGVWNLTLVSGCAPEALETLPVPSAVFVGGTKGAMDGVLDAALQKNPNVRICVSAIALETLAAATVAFEARGRCPEVTLLSVSRTEAAGRLHLLTANNPVFLISSRPEDPQ